MNNKEELSPPIYVASLSDYNAGRLHGRWIDAAVEVEQVVEEIEAILAESKEEIAEEWAVHDCQPQRYAGFAAAHR
jgi:antirestriction protein